jgi:hypothetical protein
MTRATSIPWAVALALALPVLARQDSEPPVAARLFAVVFRTGPAWDVSKPPGEQLHFKDHSRNIAALKAEGRLALGGRFGDLGLLLVRAATQQEAESLLARDASVAAGVFTAEVHPWSTFAEGCVQAVK